MEKAMTETRIVNFDIRLTINNFEKALKAIEAYFKYIEIWLNIPISRTLTVPKNMDRFIVNGSRWRYANKQWKQSEQRERFHKGPYTRSTNNVHKYANRF